MHTSVTWPINGKYTCLQCLREYTVRWDAQHPGTQPAPAETIPEMSLPSTAVAIR